MVATFGTARHMSPSKDYALQVSRQLAASALEEKRFMSAVLFARIAADETGDHTDRCAALVEIVDGFRRKQCHDMEAIKVLVEMIDDFIKSNAPPRCVGEAPTKRLEDTFIDYARELIRSGDGQSIWNTIAPRAATGFSRSLRSVLIGGPR